jgi:L-alanine-DL-glutamate epimerase-like enolase superfamily enzyme
MIADAKKLGMKVMVGCMNESSIGTAAIAQLAPMLDYVDMDGPLLLSEDIARGVDFDYGKIIYREGAGLGVEVSGHKVSGHLDTI